MISFMDLLNEHCAVAADILTQQNIDPQFFAFRWMTLLFSQEFPLTGTNVFVVIIIIVAVATVTVLAFSSC